MRRVLAPDGRLVVAVPGEDDLIELRAAATGAEVLRDRVPALLEELSPAFAPIRGEVWRARVAHDREARADALAMTYRRARLTGSEGGPVTLAAEILVFEPRLR